MREDWIEVELGKIFETVTGNTPSKKQSDNYGEDIPFVKPPDVKNNVIRKSSEYLTIKGAKYSRLIPKNSVLVTCIGNLGRIGFSNLTVAFNQQINAIKPNEVLNSKFTFYQCQSSYFRNELNNLSSATTVAIVNKGKFNTIKYRFPPLPEQRAIVSKLESLFSELDKGIENLKIAQKQLEIYRQAVLKKAFQGELTKEWREKQTDLPTAEQLLIQIKEERQKYCDNQLKEWKQKVKEWEENGSEGKKTSNPKANKPLSKINEEEILNSEISSISLMKLGEVLIDIKAGKSFKCEERTPKKDEIGVAKVSAVTWGVYNELESKTCKDISKINEDFFIEDGDFLFSRANTIELVGACVIVNKTNLKVMLSTV